MSRLWCLLVGHFYTFYSHESLNGHVILRMACRRCGDNELRWTQ